MANPASYQVLLQWTASSSTDITNDVLEMTFDRSLGTFLQKPEVGQATIKLYNVYGRYSPDNAATDLTAFKTGMEVRVTAQASGSGGDVRLFTGYVDEIVVSPAPEERNTQLKLSDIGKLLAEREVFTPVRSGTCVTSTAIDVLSSAGFTSSQISIAAIADSRAWLVFNHDRALDAITQIIETGPFLCILGRDAVVNIKDRFYANSQTTVNTYTEFFDFKYSLNDEDIINVVNLNTRRRKVDGIHSVTFMDDADDSIPVANSGWVSWRTDYFDNNEAAAGNQPVFAIGQAGSLSNFNLNLLADNSGTDRTAVSSRVLTYFGGCVVATVFYGASGTAFVTRFTNHARQIWEKNTLSIGLDNAASQSLYGFKEFQAHNDTFTTVPAMNSMATYVISLYASKTHQVEATFRNEYPFILTADVGKPLSIVHSFSGVNGKYTIMQQQERIVADAEGWIHEATYKLRLSNLV